VKRLFVVVTPGRGPGARAIVAFSTYRSKSVDAEVDLLGEHDRASSLRPRLQRERVQEVGEVHWEQVVDRGGSGVTLAHCLPCHLNKHCT
jgi:hypothetical protein